jgi:hypothetical protein
MHKKKWLQRVRPELKEEHAIQRLAWANRYAHFVLEDWKQVKWSDECSVERGEGIKPIWTFRKPSEQLYNHDIKAKRTGKSVKKMFWAGFGYDIRTELVPLDGDPNSSRGGVTAKVIYDLYQDQLPGFIQAGDIFMQDNAAVHTARIIYGLLEELGVNIMIWPPYSPDLNTIESDEDKDL